jgi:hypothetical protein
VANTYPFLVASTHTFQAIGVLSSGGGAAGSVIRFGIYADNGSGYPGARIIDCGTAASTGTGVISVTTSIALTPGLVWLTCVAQGQAGTQPTVYGAYTSRTAFALGTSQPVGYVESYQGGTISGALPASFPGSVSLAASPIMVCLEA